MLRKILSVIVGYMIFVISSLLLFRISGVKPHSETPIPFMLLTLIYGTFFSLISGFVTQFIAGTKTLKVNYFLFVIMAGFATFSLFKSSGNSWTQLLAIFVFAPVSIFGGYFLIKRKDKN
ncbi:MAG: hypothetical protein EOO44_14200 [Flavobacterium sp.]|nr:MAG: hypothetical protein EOO44_14200 [Flavobacterium sp.]